ncbi:hypothetical protein C8R44DRAFT_806029 [Mycena epipterygia]|nr:hypothetical protein C8R44DRAFT_806029 [Mycena epipterygia]
MNGEENDIVMIRFKIQSHENVADIVHLDLKTGISQTLLNLHLGQSTDYLSPGICGDIAGITIDGGREYFLVNWRTKLCCKIGRRVGSELSWLLPDYVVFAESIVTSSGPTAHITACTVDALSPHWSRIKDSHATTLVSVVALPTVLFRPFLLPHNSKSCPERLEMALHDVPLQASFYRLWVYCLWSSKSSRCAAATTSYSAPWALRCTSERSRRLKASGTGSCISGTLDMNSSFGATNIGSRPRG